MELNESIMRDGFRVLKKRFIVPENISRLDPQTKRKATICNLFVNHRLALFDVAHLVDESCSRVISVLMEQGVVEDRRRTTRTARDCSSGSRLGSRFKRPFMLDSNTR
jgi:hypothetical protein